MRLRDGLLLLRDLETPQELAPKTREESLIVRQLNNLQTKLIRAMEEEIDRPSKRHVDNINRVAFQESLILARRIGSARNKRSLSHCYEQSVLDFYQSMMVKSTLQKGQVHGLWKEVCLEALKTKNQRVRV